ncbi:MAG: hypothetical protein IPM35_28035 [Myxococcales bacterium]|nr:hypothetical protein [Myxococcales bacterium]
MKSLAERLANAKTALDQLDRALLERGGGLPSEVVAELQLLTQARAHVAPFIGAADARRVARGALDGLELRADQAGLVAFSGARVSFQHARVLLVQAYTATTWALADSMMSVLIGPLLCARSRVSNASSGPQLHTQFVGDGGKSEVPAALYNSIRQRFGWSIATSYAIRNHFLHDMGSRGGSDFFDGPTPAAGFRVSQGGWQYVESRVGLQKLPPNYHCAGAILGTPPDDLREVLDLCDTDVEEALGMLLGAACQMLRAHVACLLGED